MDLLVVAVAARLAISRGARPPTLWLLLAGQRFPVYRCSYVSSMWS
jgi:hypothetical protein